ncbi:hypothetical protein D9756_008932 [Leucocoprinus leucothites]|uniref:Uncharacterized protein n=1 Tax=Leucocoprinus leucothites TaxID=201217 RepID=A0A8H5CX05_9AGAR|nr:hypothetical protein D9756_008932 [Leucoagaricus leucothites]
MPQPSQFDDNKELRTPGIDPPEENTTFSAQRYDPLRRSRPFDFSVIGSVPPPTPQIVDTSPRVGIFQTSTSVFRSVPSTVFGQGFARRHRVGPALGRRQPDLTHQIHTPGQRPILHVKKTKKKAAAGLTAMYGWGKKALRGSSQDFM